MPVHGEDSGSSITMEAYQTALDRDDRQALAPLIEAISPREIDRAVAALEARDGIRLAYCGGYPSVISTSIPGYVVVADPGDENGVQLTIYQNRRLVAWYRRAQRWLKRNPDEDIITAMWETQERSDEL
jgi:hypothetical protein